LPSIHTGHLCRTASSSFLHVVLDDLEDPEQAGEGVIDKVKEVAQRVKDVWDGVRKGASPSVRRFTEANGDAGIASIVVCRMPVTQIYERVANILSLGKWEANKKKLQYDKMLHIYLVIRLTNGKTITFEKNHLPEITNSSKIGSDSMQAGGSKKTFRMALEGAEKAAGGDKLWVYDAFTQNCQYFARDFLRGAGISGPRLNKFIMQDAAAVVEGLPLFQKIARKITDAANVADVARNGKGKKSKADI